jgi:hypothetical protein
VPNPGPYIVKPANSDSRNNDILQIALDYRVPIVKCMGNRYSLANTV